MPEQQNRKCFNCPRLIYRDNKTGLCNECLRAKKAAVKVSRQCRSADCANELSKDNKSGLCQKCLREDFKHNSPSERVVADRARDRASFEATSLRKKYTESLKTIERQELEIKALGALGEGIETFRIEPKKGSGTSEGTVVLAAGDWHVEERVDPGTISGLNKFNPEIAQARVTRFFQGGLRLIRLLQQDIKIDTTILALLGDYITNDIHNGEQVELNEMMPMHALVVAQNMIISGIEFLLNHSKLNFVLPCHSGNHARTTRKTRPGLENGHSLEYLMYLHLAAYFRNESRVQFIIPEGYHSYVEVYGKTMRFHHGHNVQYAGGIGGIFIPAFKAVAQWNKARAATLDIFGHFHQTKDGGNFLCNGSLIGYNAYALSIKADYEPPMQTLFLLDKKRGRTCTWPIMLESPR